jgi:hypothetical protein
VRNAGFQDAAVAEASALRRLIWNNLATGSGYEEAKVALGRAKGRPSYAAVQGQRDDLIGSFAHPRKQRSSDWYKTEMNYDR